RASSEMFAQEVLLGRPRVQAYDVVEAKGDGGRLARWLLSAVLLSVIVFEASTLDPVLAFGTYLHKGLGSWTGTPIPFSLLEVLLFLGVFVSLATTVAHASPLRPTALRLAMVVFVAALLLGLLRGIFGGGDPYVAMWEIRYFLYVPACFFIVRTAI